MSSSEFAAGSRSPSAEDEADVDVVDVVGNGNKNGVEKRKEQQNPGVFVFFFPTFLGLIFLGCCLDGWKKIFWGSFCGID